MDNLGGVHGILASRVEQLEQDLRAGHVGSVSLVQSNHGRQHSTGCLPLLRAALETGEATAQQYAALADRIELLAGRLQLYATHLALDDQGRHVPTRGVVDPGGLDRRRAAIGLEAWSGYVHGVGGRPGLTGSSESEADDEGRRDAGVNFLDAT